MNVEIIYCQNRVLEGLIYKFQKGKREKGREGKILIQFQPQNANCTTRQYVPV